MSELTTKLCPVCRIGLTTSERQGVVIDQCQACNGIWLDRGELDKIIDRAAAIATPMPGPGPWLSPGQYQQNDPARDDPGRGRGWWEDVFR